MNESAPELTGGDVPELETERLRLRLLGTDDLDAVYRYLSREDVCRYLPHAPRTREQVAEKLGQAESRTGLRHDHDSVRYAVIRHDDETVLGETVLGEVVLMMEDAASACVEIGWIFHPDHAGQGYATEAASIVLDYAFGALNAHRVIARLSPDNEASVKLCTRLGLRHEAHHRQDYWIPDRQTWEDTGVYALLQSEWADRAD